MFHGSYSAANQKGPWKTLQHKKDWKSWTQQVGSRYSWGSVAAKKKTIIGVNKYSYFRSRGPKLILSSEAWLLQSMMYSAGGRIHPQRSMYSFKEWPHSLSHSLSHFVILSKWMSILVCGSVFGPDWNMSKTNDRLPLNVVQTFMVPRGQSWTTLAIPQFFLWRHQVVDICVNCLNRLSCTLCYMLLRKW